MTELTETEQKAVDWLLEKAHSGEITRAGFVKIFELAATMGDVYTKTMAAQIGGVSYNGVVHRSEPVKFPGAQLVSLLPPKK